MSDIRRPAIPPPVPHRVRQDTMEDLTPPPLVLRHDRSTREADLEMELAHLRIQLGERETQLAESAAAQARAEQQARVLKQKNSQLVLEVNRLRRRLADGDDDITKRIELPARRARDAV